MKHVYSKREDGTYVFFTAESYFAFEDCTMSLAQNHLMSSTDPVKSFYVILHKTPFAKCWGINLNLQTHGLLL